MGKRILIVDDSASIRSALVTTLGGAGYEVAQAPDGSAALAELSSPPDLMITDFNMPRMNGLQLIFIARALPQCKRMPIIMLTTESEDSKRQSARAAGATAWMVKPFQPKQLLAVVEKLIESVGL
jgi:two-component system chemotaxis response regulator CheY